MAIKKIDGKEYDLNDHKLCALGGVYNCAVCAYLTGCCRGYEGHSVGSSHRNKQTFKRVNPNV